MSIELTLFVATQYLNRPRLLAAPGHPTPPQKLAARMPFSSRYGGFWFEGPTDRGLLQRSYGLFELAASNPHVVFGTADAKAKSEALRPLAYGPQFRYEEYMVIMSSWAVTAAFSWIVTSALKLVFASSSVRSYVVAFSEHG